MCKRTGFVQQELRDFVKTDSDSSLKSLTVTQVESSHSVKNVTRVDSSHHLSQRDSNQFRVTKYCDSSRVIDSSHAITGKCLYILFHLSLGLELLNRAFQGSSVHELSNKYYTMGVDRASGCIWAMASEVYNLTKVVPRLSENGDVIKTQIIICAMLSSNFVQGRPKFFAQVPRNCWDQHFQYIHCFYSIQYKF